MCCEAARQRNAADSFLYKVMSRLQYRLSVRWYQPHNSVISLLLSFPFFCSYCLFLYLTIRRAVSLLLASSLLAHTVALPPLGSEEG
ncbi:unnamed protein product [Bubo scandiacus]